MMRLILCGLIAALGLAGCDGRSAPDEQAAIIPLEEPAIFIRLPAVQGRPAAGYFELRVAGDRGALVSVSSPQAKRIEMHETTTSATMSSMRPIDRVPAGDGAEIAFRPGGRHLMLYDLDPGLAPGKQAQLVVHFTKGEPMTLTAAVVAAGGEHGGH